LSPRSRGSTRRSRGRGAKERQASPPLVGGVPGGAGGGGPKNDKPLPRSSGEYPADPGRGAEERQDSPPLVGGVPGEAGGGGAKERSTSLRVVEHHHAAVTQRRLTARRMLRLIRPLPARITNQ